MSLNGLKSYESGRKKTTSRYNHPYKKLLSRATIMITIFKFQLGRMLNQLLNIDLLKSLDADIFDSDICIVIAFCKNVVSYRYRYRFGNDTIKISFLITVKH